MVQGVPASGRWVVRALPASLGMTSDHMGGMMWGMGVGGLLVVVVIVLLVAALVKYVFFR